MPTTTKPKIVTMKAALLVRDDRLFPRYRWSDKNYASILRSLEAGFTLPPIVADEETLKVVDGNHRLAAELARDLEAEITVELRQYADENEMYKDAVRLNAHHGQRLTEYDHAHILATAEARGISREEIAGALGMTVDKAAGIRRSRTAYDRAGKPVQIKRSARHLAGENLSDAQVQANERSQGFTVRFHCNQIENAIEGDLIDWDNESEVGALHHLAEVIADHLAVHT